MTTFTSGVFQKETVKYFNMKNNAILVSIIVALVFGAGGFFGGMKYTQSRRGNGTAGARFIGQNGPDRAGLPAGRQGFRPVAGEIVSSDEKSLTVKLPDGSSKIVLLTGITTISKSADGSVADLKTGERVSVFGTENTDGSVTAQNVQVRPSTP